jgi:hypothetical protein
MQIQLQIMKILKSPSFILLSAAFLAACVSNPETDQAKVSEAEKVIEISGKEINIMPSEANMEWVGTKPTGRHYGTILLGKGILRMKERSIIGGKLVFDLTKIEVTDLKDNQEMHAKLVDHLQSVDFFDAPNHPQATFEIVSLKTLNTAKSATTEYDAYSKDMQQPVAGEKIMEVGDYKLKGATHEILGNLTMRGKTFAITVPAVVDITKDSVYTHTNFSIDRTKWGLMYGDESKVVDKAKDKFIYNIVGIGLKIKASLNATR